MPGTHRTPPKSQDQRPHQVPPAGQQAQAARDNLAPGRVQDIDFHGDVVKLFRAGDRPEQAPGDFGTIFRNKNAHVKRTVTRTNNVLTPLELKPKSAIHQDDITLLKNHLQKIDAAINTLHACIDDDSWDVNEEDLTAYSVESDSHIPSIMDIRERVFALEKSFQDLLKPPMVKQPALEPRSANKIDNTFRPRPLDKSATPAVFHKWHRELKIYIRRNGFENAPVDEQRVLLNNCLTPDMEDMLERLCLPEENDSLEDIIASLKTQLEQSNNLVTRRFKYFNCVQKYGESIDQYIVRFRKLGDYADFDKFDYNDNMVCRILTGIHDEKLRRELLRLPKKDCTFENVKQLALAWEASHINAELIGADKGGDRGDPAGDVQVDKISTYKANKRSNFNNSSSSRQPPNQGSSKRADPSPSDQNGRSCFNCGNARHPLAQCPARDKTCNYCKKLGHLSKVCRKAKSDKHAKSGQPVQTVEDDRGESHQEEDSSSNVGTFGFHVFKVDERVQAPTPRIHAALSAQDRHLGNHAMVPDTGAALSVIPASMTRLWGLSLAPLDDTHSLRAANGTYMQCIGTVSLTVDLNGVKSDVVFFVCEDVNNIILSWLALKTLLVISDNFPTQAIRQVHSEVISHTFALFKNRCVKEYPTVFHTNKSLSQMHGAPMMIHLNENFDPQQVKQTSRPRPVPIPLRKSVRAEIDRMVKDGIIRPIQDPTDFVSPLVVVPKKDNTVRLVIDYTQLNKFIKRPNHPFPSVAEVRALVPPSAKYFATLDAVQGYLQIPLHTLSQPLTTFITPWGRYCFTRAPMGLASSGDVFCARGDEVFAGIPGIIKVVDDILVFAEDQDQLRHNVRLVLEAAKKHNISLSAEKFKVGEVVDFVGLTISMDSIRPDDKHFAAIARFPEPSNRTDLRSFLGMANQFSSFSSNIARLAKPLRPLLSKTSKWHWDDTHHQSFRSLRTELVQSSTLHCFHPERPTKLLTDASRLNGLGYALMQRVEDKWVLISCGSRFITDTEANYAVFELEALAIVWSIQKCRMFLLGLPSFEVVTDHRPLVSIFNSTRLSKTDNPRILRLLQKISMYSFAVRWTPGRQHQIPDALSRSPLPCQSASTVANVCDDEAPVTIHPDQAVVSMAREALHDPAYQDIVHAVRTMDLGAIKKLPLSTHAHVRILASLWDRLSVDADTGLILLDATRIFVPKLRRPAVIQQIHVAHQGITRTKARMQALFFWPGMANQVVQAVQSCPLCQKFRDEQPSQPLRPHAKPPRPFHAVSTDVFEYNRSFFVTYVDRFSGWTSVIQFQKSPSTAQITAALLSIFKDFGIPNNIRHDGATPFVSAEFKEFMTKHNIRDELTSAYNPSSNGHAEASVKAMKLLVKKCWLKSSLDKNKFAEALLEWRNTPRYPGNLSPAEMVFGRKLRSGAPCITYDKVPEKAIQNAATKNFDHTKHLYESHNNFRKPSLPPLEPGDPVRIRNTLTKAWDKTGTVVKSRDHGQSYIVEIQGRQFLRNRRFLKKII